MQTYFFFGSYTQASLHEARSNRTDVAVGILEELNGQILSIYALLGEHDLVIIANLPGNTEALKASVSLSREIGVQFSTRPAVSVDRFDSLLGNSDDLDFPDFKFPPPDRLPPGNDMN